jgi:superfamily I DNA and/or RNA helicase
MNSKIMEFSSQELYEGRLQAHDSVKDHLLCDIVNTDRDVDIESVPRILRVPTLLVNTEDCDMHEMCEVNSSTSLPRFL